MISVKGRKKGCVYLIIALSAVPLILSFIVCTVAYIYETTYGKNAPTSSSVDFSDDCFENFQNSQVKTDSEPNTTDNYDEYENLIYYTEASNFSEGIAWVRISEFSNTGEWLNSKRACINISGEIIYSTLESTNWSDHIADFEPTQFVQGVSIVDETTLINNKGEIVWSVNTNGWNYADEKFGSGVTKSIKIYDGGSFTGYTFVRFFIDSYDQTANYCGVLNPDGSWRTEPFLVKDEVSFSYNGIYSFRTTDETGYYNDSCQYDAYNNTFINDIDLTDINTVNILTEKRNQYYFGFHNNMMYNSEEKVFEDISGNVVIDLSGYTSIDCKKDSSTGYYSSPSFNNGYCVLSVRNKQNSKYMTVIDTYGNQLFEPIKCVRYENIVSDGLLLAEVEDDVDVFLNMNGEVAIIPDGEANTFSEGYAVVYKKDPVTDMYVYSYIDTNGNTVLR